MNNIIIIALVSMIVGLCIYQLHPIWKQKLMLNDLTGLYYYKKTPSGNVIMVQYIDVNKILRFRKATSKDIQALKSLGLL